MSVHFGGNIKTEYKKYTYGAWSQPVLTANDSNSSFIVSASSYWGSGHEPWRSFSSTTTGNQAWCSAAGTAPSASSPQYYYFTTDVPIKISTITIKNRVYSAPDAISSGVLQASEDNSTWIDIKSFTNSNNTSGATWTITVNETRGYKYHRFKLTGRNGSDNNVCLGYPTINATKQTGSTAGTSSDYDYITFNDGKIKSIHKGDLIKTKYYKYTYASWTMQKLSANGTSGGDSYAAQSSSNYSGKINFIYKGNTLVYASTVNDDNYLKQPYFSQAVTFSQGTAYKAEADLWLSVGSNRTGANDPYLDICPDSAFGSNTVRVFMMTQRAGISYSCGGTMIPIKKGWYYKSVNLTTVLLKIPCVPTDGKIPYEHRNGLTKMPDYTTGVSVSQNTVKQATYDLWLYTRGNTRKIEIGKTSSSFTVIAEGVVSACEEPSTLVFIEKGLYYRTTGTDNKIFKCLGG